MSIYNEQILESGIYFVTFTIYKWIPLFSITGQYNLVYNWFDALRRKGHSILGYVIMPNHVHVLIGYVNNGESLNKAIGNGKRFIAYGIVAWLKENSSHHILHTLEEGVSVAEKKKGKQHEVFESKPDILLCHSYKFVAQKLDYIHSNPSSKKWALVTDVSAYEHSSAGFYISGVQGVYEIEHVNGWIAEKWK